MSISWCNGWRELTEKHRHYIEGELRWELDQISDHPLIGSTFRVVGGCNLYDDFILQLDDGRYGYVHLSWKQAAPTFTRLGDDKVVATFLCNWKEQPPDV